jgi:hypothetical protein
MKILTGLLASTERFSFWRPHGTLGYTIQSRAQMFTTEQIQ